MTNNRIRNIAIIAHVDHGKTTLVNQMLKQGGIFRDNQVISDRVMDNNDLEKERGITILAKNTAIFYQDYQINIVDTPGHADFGGEVERTLKMVDGALLLVDALEGIMPQTRFVLSKALEQKLKVIVVINKVDRPELRIKEVVDEVIGLLMDLDADEEQLERAMIFCSARLGHSGFSVDKLGNDLIPLFDTIIKEIPAPTGDENKMFQMLVSALDYSDYLGSIAIGKISNGKVKENQLAILKNYYRPDKKIVSRVSKIFRFQGLNKIAIAEAGVGDIICLSGIENITIGDTIGEEENFEPLFYTKISEPTVEMTFSINNSPFFGKEGTFVTSTHLRERLFKAAIKDVSLKIKETDSADAYIVCGRGEMHLAILIENMRREGYEFSVSAPKALFQEKDGEVFEPVDLLTVDVPDEHVNTVMAKMNIRKGELMNMTYLNGRTRLEFQVPARGLFGYKNEFLTDTQGEGILASIFLEYQKFKGAIKQRNFGSLIASEQGVSNAYGLYHSQERGTLMIGPGENVYEGMVVGFSPKAQDLVINVCKKKKLTNMRASGTDEALRLTPPTRLSLEQCLDFIASDELIEVTPQNVRIRKKILSAMYRAKDKYNE